MSALYGRSYAEATLNIGNFDNTTTTNISTIRIISTKMRRLNGSYIPQLMNYVVPRDQLYTFYNYIFYNHYFYINSFHKHLTNSYTLVHSTVYCKTSIEKQNKSAY